MIFKKKIILNKAELECLHSLLSKIYSNEKLTKSELNDILYLRMRINEVLNV